MRFSEAIKEFTSWRKFKVRQGTLRGYDNTLRSFCLYLRDPKIEDIGIQHIMEYLNGMEALGWDKNSFIGKSMALRKFFEFFALQGFPVINKDLIPIPNREYKVPRVCIEEQYKKLLDIIPTKTSDPRHIRNLAIVNMLWDTGARNNEILSLDVGDIDTNRKRAVINTEKSRGRRPFREIFWTGKTNSNLNHWLDKREDLKKKMRFKESDALFISICGANTSGKRFTIKGVGEMLRRYCHRGKLPHINAHSLRHHMGHHVVNSGGTNADVMNILGHASIASTTIYTMMVDKELEARYRKFNGS